MGVRIVKTCGVESRPTFRFGKSTEKSWESARGVFEKVVGGVVRSKFSLRCIP